MYLMKGMIMMFAAMFNEKGSMVQYSLLNIVPLALFLLIPLFI